MTDGDRRFMSPRTLIQDLFEYNDWANERLLALSAGLGDMELDAERPMGLGSLRATLYHLAFAERLWLDRWQGKPWAPLQHQPGGISLSKLGDEFRSTAAERNDWLQAEAADGYSRIVDYMNSSREPFRHRLRELLMHVVNHAVHHRAQALNYLRSWGRQVAGGLDYLFFRLSHPTVPSDPASITILRANGLEVSDRICSPPLYDAETIRRYCSYGNWAMEMVLNAVSPLSEAQLDQSFDIGPGTLRKTLQHIHDAERWWYQSWIGQPDGFSKSTPAGPVSALVDSWRRTAAQRDQWLAGKTSADLSQIVAATPAGATLHVRVGESAIQLCGHGTHHRAQAINMLRRLGKSTLPSDYVVWIRGPGALPVNNVVEVSSG